MDPAFVLVITLRVMRDYQQTIDSLLARIAELEAQQRANGVVPTAQEVPDGVSIGDR